MKYLTSIIMLTLFITLTTGCGDDEDPVSNDCEGVLASGGDMIVDGETLNLSVAQLLTTSGLDGVVYQFQVGGISSDCSGSKVISFVIEIPNNSELNGVYPIMDFFDAGLGDFYGVNIVDQIFDPVSQSLTQVNSGTIEMTKHAEKEYSVKLNGDLITGGTIDVSFRKAF